MTGYKRMKASDPEEQRLRDEWHQARNTRDEEGGETRLYWASRALSEFLWKRASSIVETDRSRHPKAKRNWPKGSEGPSGDRSLP